MTDFRVEVQQQGSGTVVLVAGEIDIEVSPALRECLFDQTGMVVVDLAKVAFLDSSGMAAFAAAQRRLGRDGGKLSLRDPQPPVRRVLEVTGLDLWIEPSAE